MSLLRPPVRSCCGQRHRGPVCPDGKVMCQLCFERVPTDQLAVQDGNLVDVCVVCWAREQGFKMDDAP